jgi:hypothetical protein
MIAQSPTSRQCLLLKITPNFWHSLLVSGQRRGHAALLTEGDAYEAGIALLRQKYPQYEHVPLDGRPLIVIAVTQVRGWRARTAWEG